MALTFDLTDTAMSDGKAWATPEQSLITDTFIMCAPVVGMGRITHANKYEYLARLILLGLFDMNTPVSVIDPYVGLVTNATFGPDESRAKWLKRVMSRRLDDAIYNMKA